MAIAEIVAERTDLGEAEAEHLGRLTEEWQLLADLAFADLLLVCPGRRRGRLVVVAQMRPYTAATLHEEDQVGRALSARQSPFAARALSEGRIVREGDPVWRGGTPVRVEAIPVRFRGKPIAAISQQSNLATARTPSRLELTYLRTAGDLATMIAEGTFPFAAETPDPAVLPRVGDGLMRLGPTGRVEYASPNALSAYRRLGITENLFDRPLAGFDLDPQRILGTASSHQPAESEVEGRGSVVLRRAIPLVKAHDVTGIVVLMRDVTDLRRRDRMLRLKDATIREIHHRVKNNLQTVASLLRLQARRLRSPEAREALEESERRIRSIALVHDTLALEWGDVVDFDQVATEVVHMVREGLAAPGIDIGVQGSCGKLSAQVATPLAVILTELLQNSVDHAFGDGGGTITVVLGRHDDRVDVEVRDDGRGLPAGFDPERGGLGLQIVRALVESELRGRIAMDGDHRGVRVRLEIPAAEPAG